MKNLFLFVLISAFFLTAVFAVSALQKSGSKGEVPNRLIGAWWLTWLEEPDASGTLHKADCTGLLVYTLDGHISVQVMYRSPQTDGQSGPVQYALGGYEASFGTYRVDENSHTFVFHVEGAMVRSLVGKDLPRVYEISGNQLIVKSANPNEHWRVVWERY